MIFEELNVNCFNLLYFLKERHQYLLSVIINLGRNCQYSGLLGVEPDPALSCELAPFTNCGGGEQETISCLRVVTMCRALQEEPDSGAGSQEEPRSTPPRQLDALEKHRLQR